MINSNGLHLASPIVIQLTDRMVPLIVSYYGN